VKLQKNDAADAEAIMIAAQRPEMRFVHLNPKISRPERRCCAPVNAWSISAPSS